MRQRRRPSPATRPSSSAPRCEHRRGAARDRARPRRRARRPPRRDPPRRRTAAAGRRACRTRARWRARRRRRAPGLPAPPLPVQACGPSGANVLQWRRVPSWTDAEHPLWKWLLRICAAATALPLWSASHLPFTDLPQHVAAIGTLRHWWDPVWKSQEYFTLALGQTQYLLYYLAGAAMAFPLGTAERANVVLLSLTAIAFPWSLRALLRALHADERLALFGCTLFWSQALLIGFFNYLAAMPLLLWGLSLAVRQALGPSRKTLWILGAISVALFYLHLSAFIFFAPAAAMA